MQKTTKKFVGVDSPAGISPILKMSSEMLDKQFMLSASKDIEISGAICSVPLFSTLKSNAIPSHGWAVNSPNIFTPNGPTEVK